ncbi:PGC-1 and ERR-induced regulator in muscle protein 1 isoform X1 [Crotalus tigris]|uniref:PGC-1 and ERR-induced regulator in muscle protein 1 isoform X1 n=1 Tax=Crotalus tigris TaxID=88082 RepID=UPI00192F91FB|nr:PGC-1 and ERR-induced regulator in muscle protein 1 isoform X1 [Crotalus tigris]XP_039223446.1 PGC-1 and ERR-induced regulator in muscle protein 1 isoform X1 [Crotalus tigris]
MENFEYSIQLNDRDWAEFYFVSEECRLISPALATAEDQLLSDLEEGEAEEKRGPAHPKNSCFSPGIPSGHLLAEDALSGSEDETDVGSVGRFLCRNQQVFLPPQSSPSPYPSLTLNPGPATSSVPLSVAEEQGVGIVGWPMDPETKTEAHITQERDLQEPLPRPETREKSLVLPLGPSPVQETLESQPRAVDLKLHYAEDYTSPTASGGCRFPGSASNSSICGKADFPKLRDAALEASGLRVSSVLSPTSGEAETPETEVKCLQVVSRTPFQETRSPSEEPSVQVTSRLVHSRASASGKKEEDVLKTERGVDHSPNTSQERDQAKDNGVEGCPEVLEEDASPQPSLEVDQRGSDPSSGKMERQNKGEPCLHLGVAIPPEGDALTGTQGSPRLAPYHPKSNDCSEEALTTMTWPEVYDYFFSDDLHEVEGPSSPERRSRETISHGHQSELPAMSGPELYEYFFQDVDETVTGDETWSQVGPSEASLSSAHRLAPSLVLEEPAPDTGTDSMGFPEVYEHFFAHPPQGKSSRTPNILAVPASELGKALRALTSLIGRPVRFLTSQPRRRGSQAGVMLVSPKLLDGPSLAPENLEVAVLKPERPLQLVITPRDLCLGFVALASWAVKTSNLQAPDAWKIVLLANFGTLSAIRCFRRQVVMENYHSS